MPAVHGDREGRLPAGPPGYYREYTVPTRLAGPGRITMGKNRERCYTPDHYRTFERVTE